jgi:DNA-binding NarL/FixJ family response regulator
MNQITVLLSEDHAILRDGLRSLLATEKDIQIVGEACNGREAVEQCLQLHPDVVIMDIGMPTLNGIEATRQILRALPATKVLILSAYTEMARVEEAMSLGASGYLMKQTEARFLPAAIRAARAGRKIMSPAIARYLHGLEKAGRPKPKHLTSREAEVLQLVAEGRANKQVSAELNISVKTVQKHRQSLMDKLNIHDTAGLTRYAMANGFVVPDATLPFGVSTDPVLCSS